MKNKTEKTNVMRVLDSLKVAYTGHEYEADSTLTGEQIAGILGEDVTSVFKTLVTRGKSGQYYVFVIPVAEELHLKKAASVVGEKSVEMIKQKELLPLTGYVHGGCSPIGMKKKFPTYIHESCSGLEKMYVSGGKVGMQIELAPSDLIRAAACNLADLV